MRQSQQDMLHLSTIPRLIDSLKIRKFLCLAMSECVSKINKANSCH